MACHALACKLGWRDSRNVSNNYRWTAGDLAQIMKNAFE
jgi:hypothetical protein